MPDVRLASPRGKWLLLTTVLGSGMAMLDSTVVNVAPAAHRPRPGREPRRPAMDGQRVPGHAGRADPARRLPRGPVRPPEGLRPGVVWFAAASLLCGLAPTEGVLIAARALQGIGGALLTPGSLALIQASFHPDDRSRAVGLWSGFGGIGAAVGPFLGGWLVAGPGWRWVFLLNSAAGAAVRAGRAAARTGVGGRAGPRPLRRPRRGTGRRGPRPPDVRAHRGPLRLPRRWP